MKLADVSITSIASALPDEKITNQNIVEMRPDDISPDEWTTNEWIVQRTGVEERRRAPKGWGSTDLMVPAAQKALALGKKNIEDIELLVVTTSFSQYGSNCPRSAEDFKAKIGAKQSTLSVGEDAECAGFVWAVIRAQMEMTCYGFKNALVVSGDKTTAFTNYRDRKTCPLFGDGAGAIILEPCEEGYGILATYRATNTEFIKAIKIPAGGSQMPFGSKPEDPENIDPKTGEIRKELFYMQMPGGKEMLHYIGRTGGPEACRKVCELAGISLSQLKKIFPHQANIRMSEQIEHYLGLPKGIMFKETQKIYGNTSGSSEPIALDTGYGYGMLDFGDYYLVVGFGAGFILGAFLGRWTMEKFTG